MNTVVIEILRSGQVNNQLLQKNTSYIALCGSYPAKDFIIDCDQKMFDEHVKLLRYNEEEEEESRQLSIGFFQDLISGIIDQIYPEQLNYQGGNDVLHLRLVTTPKEIAQLPFEMALTPVPLQKISPRIPFFINDQVKTTFTREVRHVSFDHYNWPFKPRILFAWAQPGDPVPFEEQLNAFVRVLRPWAIPLDNSKTEIVPDVGALITILENATLTSIRNEITRAIDKKEQPYTHVHILAHGSASADQDGEQFLLVLNSDKPNETSFYAEGSDLIAALTVEKDSEKHIPQVVSLSSCDSGNMGSPVHPVGSLAHFLHRAGVPCVFASQFPLTQEGSVQLVETLYSQLLQSSDPRLALYHARKALNMDGTHDWASLVAYARFPEDIDEQMKDIRLKILLEFMKTSNGLADHVIRYMNTIDKDKVQNYFAEVTERLNNSIANLTTLLKTTSNGKINKLRYAEHYGLIGSAYKRKAEHLFRVAQFNGKITPDDIKASTDALENARDSYLRGYKYLNSHWNGTQYLSLFVVINRNPGEEERETWVVSSVMSKNDENNATDDESLAWAYGTLAELYLLRPFVEQAAQQQKEAAMAKSKQYLQKLNALTGQQFPKESTARQFERYINWWPKIFESETMSQLNAMATEIRKELPTLESLLPKKQGQP